MNDDHTRKDDTTIDRVEQMLIDHITTQNSWNRTHDEKAEFWRDKVEKRFEPVEDFIKSVSWSYKFLLGLAAFIGMSLKAWDYIKKHWNP